VIVAEAGGPVGKLVFECGDDFAALIELDAMALAVVEADGLDAVVTVKRRSEADSGVLSAGE